MKKLLTEKNKTLIFKWWLAGAVYLFIGFGTIIGSYQYIYDLIFFLTLALFIADRFIYQPVVNLMFNIEDDYTKEINNLQRLSKNLKQFIVIFITVCLIMLTYNIVNIGIIYIFSLDPQTIIIPTEPILFGVLYVLYTEFIKWLLFKISSRLKRNENEKIIY